jgi:hypothetical protein
LLSAHPSLAPWLLEPGPLFPLVAFRVLFGLACLVKAITDTRRGYHRFFDGDSYLRYRYLLGSPRGLITPARYRAIYALKVAAPLLVLSGVATRPALAALALAYGVELRVYFKYHVNLMFLVSLILLVSPGIDAGLTLPGLVAAHGDGAAWLASALALRGEQLARVAIVGTMCVLYVAAGCRKLNRVFLRGSVVHTCVRHVMAERADRRHFDVWAPRWFIERFVKGDPRALDRVWAPWMWLTVAIEGLLPLLLLSRATFAGGVLLGVVMHAAFTAMFPATLLHFSLLSLSTYVLFCDPHALTSAAARLLGVG